MSKWSIFAPILYIFSRKNLLFFRNSWEYLRHYSSSKKGFRIKFSSSCMYHEAIILYALIIWIHWIDISIYFHLRWILCRFSYLYEKFYEFFSGKYSLRIGIISIKDILSVGNESISLEFITNRNIKKVTCSWRRCNIIKLHNIYYGFTFCHNVLYSKRFIPITKETFLIHEDRECFPEWALHTYITVLSLPTKVDFLVFWSYERITCCGFSSYYCTLCFFWSTWKRWSINTAKVAIDKCHWINCIFLSFIFIETYIDSIIKTYSSGIWFRRSKMPVWMKRCITRIYLEMKMWCSGYPRHSDTTNHISFSYLCTLFHQDFWEVEISWINTCFCSIYIYSIMTYDNKSIPSTICLDSPYGYTICNSEYWCAKWGPYIDTKMSSCIFTVVELIISHIWCYICIVKNCRWFCWIVYIKEGNRIIKWNKEIFANRNILKSSHFILIGCLCPVWNIGNRHSGTIEWIRQYFCICISSSFHVWYPDLLHGYTHSKDTVAYPYNHYRSREPGRRIKHSTLYLFFSFDVSISYYFNIGKFWKRIKNLSYEER